MIHTVYSNSYEVLRVCLMNNIEALGVSTGGSGGASLFERAFEKVPSRPTTRLRRTSAAPSPTATASARASTS